MTALPQDVASALERENARLRDELRTARERQAATSDILKVIASSPSDVQPVFDVIVGHALRLCGGRMGRVYRYDNGIIHLVAGQGLSAPGLSKVQEVFPRPAADDTTAGRAIQSRRPYFVTDIESDQSVPALSRQMIEALGTRSQVTVPMLRGGEPIGAITVGWAEPGAYGDQQVALLQTFADQAVIAIENVRLFNETREALERQTATADILKVIASSPSDVQPVFDAIATSANRLIGGFSSTVFRFIDGIAYLKAFTPTTPAADEVLQATFPRPAADFPPFRMAQAGGVTQIPDTEALSKELLDISRARGFRSMLFTPLMNDGDSIGLIAVTRAEPGAFADHHVQLLRTFADQAVIAIENAGLFEEVQTKTRDLEEALTYQTGSSNILSVIASSPTEVEPVLKAIVESACQLCDAYDAVVLLRESDDLRFSAHHGPIPIDLEKSPINRNWVTGRAVVDRVPMHVHDLLSAEGDQFPQSRETLPHQGHRTVLSVPLLREGESIGAITLRRFEVNPFTDKQIALLQTFADQAVIAIGNVRLFEEVQAKTRDLTEALQQQTATSEVLKVISSSPGELEPVFKSMLENAVSICDAKFGNLFLIDGDGARWEAGVGTPPKLADYFTQSRSFRPTPGSHLERVMRTKQVSHTADDAAEPVVGAAARLGGARSTVCVPLVKDEELVGAIFIYRTEVRSFTDKQIALLKQFAAQAVIAIENARLLRELRASTEDLRESLQQQTATAEVLQIISSSPGDLAPVFEKMLENATRVCGAEFGSMNLVEDGAMRQAALYNAPPAFAAVRINKVSRPHPLSVMTTAVRTKQVIHLADLRTNPSYLERAPATVELVELGGARTVATVPMLRDDEVIGVITIYRQEVRPFGDKQIELLSNFAKQAVIAIENARLLKELRQRTNDLTASLDNLRTAQDRLVQTEKLASLGQLTAGIAHEIKNPLNFVNNFSALSAELTDELNEVLKQATLAGKVREEVDELTRLLKDNLEKVVQHGKRADSIVKNMLLHSREGSGDHRPADINALLDESLNLAYHGARAEKPQFNVTLQRNFDPNAGLIEVFPQEITRVFLNLISNGFYAVTKRKADNGTGFDPVVSATTKNRGDHVEIRIRDNGIGIPAHVKEKMFNPFFTTKPAGEGTGLGLSMSHDIIVKQHGGTIDVVTEPGQFTEFTVVLPRASNPSNKTRG